MQKDLTLEPIDSTRDRSRQRPLKIAICPPDFERLKQVMGGGPADATYLLQRYIATGLQARGHDVSFVAQVGLGETVCTKDLRQPKVAAQTWVAGSLFELASKVTWRLQRTLGIPYLNGFSNVRLFDACLGCLPGHDVVYSRHGIYKTGVARACKRLGLPYVLFVEADEILEHDYMGTPITGVLRWRAQQMFRFNLDAADCIICVSAPLKRHLETNWGVSPRKVVVFSNAVDIDVFRPDSRARAEVRASLEIDDRPLVIFVGNFYKWHDVATLLEAFSQVLPTHPDAMLVLVGDGAERQAMIRHAADLGVDHATRFTGYVPHHDVPKFMSAADLAVAPYPESKQELWLSPLKVYEYMAAGTPVIASAAGQLVDLVRHGENGLLVPPGDSSKLAATMKSLLSDGNLRKQLSRQARLDVAQNHSWERYLSRLECLFAAVMDREAVDEI